MMNNGDFRKLIHNLWNKYLCQTFWLRPKPNTPQRTPTPLPPPIWGRYRKCMQIDIVHRQELGVRYLLRVADSFLASR